MKRMLVFLVMLTLMAGMVWAGGKTEKKADAEGIPVLHWYLPGSDAAGYIPEVVEQVYARANEIIEAEIGVNVEFHVLGSFGDYKTKMPLILASGETVDLCWSSNWSNDFMTNATAGLYHPLEDLLPQYAPTVYKDIKGHLEVYRIDGSIYGIWPQNTAIQCSTVMVKRDLYDKYKWDLSKIKRMVDIEPILADIKAGERDITPLSPRWFLERSAYELGFTDLGTLVEIIGVRRDDPNLKVLNLFETAEFKEYMQTVVNWYKKGYIQNDILTIKEDEMKSGELAGKYGIMMHNTYNPASDIDVSGPGWKVYPIGTPVVSRGRILSTVTAMGMTTSNKEKSAELMELMWTNAELLRILSYGLEGTNYKLIDPNRFEYIENSGYRSYSWILGNTYNGLIQGTEMPANQFELVQAANKAAEITRTMGFGLSLEDIKTEVASVSAVKDQYYQLLSFGASDNFEKDYQAFMSALKKAGIDDLIEKIQKQLDDWAASQ